MKKMIRCKSCGFIMEEGKLKDKCPACGVPGKMFEPYTPGISEKRMRILQAHIHPIIVHAPQAFTVFILLLSAVTFFSDEAIKRELYSAIRVMTVLLPLVVLGSIGAGIFDGVIRFRKATTPILIKKIMYGIVFFLFSAGMLILVLFFGLGAFMVMPLFMAFNAICFISSAILGLLGTSLLDAKFPG
jgi:hypothetical protein